MATYLPNITDMQAPILPFQPDFNFLNFTLTQATQKWEIASQQATQIYHAYLEANHLNQHVKNMRNEYRKKIDNKLTELAAHNLTDIRVMKSFRELVTGLSNNPYYLYDLQITRKYDEVMGQKEMWEKVAPSEGTGHKHWNSQIESGLNKMLSYYQDKELNEGNLPLFSFVYSNVLDPVQIDEESYINGLTTDQFNKLRTGVQGNYLIGTNVSFAGPSVGGIRPYIVKEIGGNGIRGHVHDIVLKDFQDGAIKRLYEQKAIADLFIQGAKYNYDWGKVVEHYKSGIDNKYKQLENTIQQVAKYATNSKQQAIGYMASNMQAAGAAMSLLQRLDAEKKGHAAQVLDENAKKEQNVVDELQKSLERYRKQGEKITKADLGTALVASRLYNFVGGMNDIIVSANKWVDAHTVRDIEYNKAFGDYLDYLSAMARIRADREAAAAEATGPLISFGGSSSLSLKSKSTLSNPDINTTITAGNILTMKGKDADLINRIQASGYVMRFRDLSDKNKKIVELTIPELQKAQIEANVKDPHAILYVQHVKGTDIVNVYIVNRSSQEFGISYGKAGYLFSVNKQNIETLNNNMGNSVTEYLFQANSNNPYVGTFKIPYQYPPKQPSNSSLEEFWVDE